MRSYFAFVVVIPSLASAAIYTDDPILPRSVIVRGTGSIVDPDSWTPFPTSAPVVTFEPTAFPSITTEAPTSAEFNLKHKGGRKECEGQTAVPKNECLEGATIAGSTHSFPYHLNEVNDSTLPCACSLFWNENGSIMATFNDSGECEQNDDTSGVCKSCGGTSEKQNDYRGDISVTESGIPCQAWSSQSPQTHTFTRENHPGKGLGYPDGHASCRNPDDGQRAWCFTTDPGTAWEYCDVPYC